MRLVSAYVSRKMAFTVGSRGSIMEVMNPQAKNNVVMATNADFRLRCSVGIGPPSNG